MVVDHCNNQSPDQSQPNDSQDHSNVSGGHDNRAMPASISLPPNLKFGPFKVASQVFYISPKRLSFGLVNLKPLLAGHVLISPVRSVPRLSQLTIAETSDLFLTVRRVSHTLERLYSAQAFNVAVQDGVEAGQSVPHVHVHIIPRRKKDMESRGGGDAIYEMMDGDEGDIGSAMVEMVKQRKERGQAQQGFGGPDADSKRVARSEEEMRKEAEWLMKEMEKDSNAVTEDEEKS